VGQNANPVYQGFGAQTPGGEGKPIYHVTNLSDSGPGSLRDALSQGNRYIVFDVAGEISLQSRLYVTGSNITIDGFSAPSPGITLKNYGPFIHGTRGAHDIILRGIRVRDTESGRDAIQIAYGAYNIVVDHISVSGSGDGNLDITENAHDVTVSWSILAKPAGTEKNMLIKYNPSRITLHHNIFLHALQRNPQVRIDDPGTRATTTTVDMRNNLVWGWQGGYGTSITHGPWANVVDNFYSAAGGDPKRALAVSNGARAYVAGNFSNDNLTDLLNSRGTEGMPFTAPVVDTTDACTAAHHILAAAGVQPRDAVDQKYLSTISLPACGGVISPALASSPGRLDFVATVNGSNPGSKTLSVTSNGSGLSWSAAMTGAPWLTLSPASGTTPSNVIVQANSSGLAAATYLGIISVTGPGAQNSPLSIPVSLTVSSAVPPPQPVPPSNVPLITTPLPGSTLANASVNFVWAANTAKVKKWQLYVGTTRGASNLYDSGKLSNSVTSRSVSGLPTDGRTIWAQLRFDIGGTWQSADFQYTARQP
jgi:pectate lyase